MLRQPIESFKPYVLMQKTSELTTQECVQYSVHLPMLEFIGIVRYVCSSKSLLSGLLLVYVQPYISVLPGY